MSNNQQAKGKPGKLAMVKIQGKQELRITGHRENRLKAEHREADDGELRAGED